MKPMALLAIATLLLGNTFSDDTSNLPEAKPSQVVELADGASYMLVASPVKQKIAGKWLRRLAYNGSVPGPVLHVTQGATIRLTLKNETDLETTLHPHGLRIDDRNDGVVGVGQPPIKPGASHEYKLSFPDPGMFWYHPHIREDYTQDAGMYGNFWVKPKDPEYYNEVHRELPLVIDDALIRNPKPYFRDRTTHTLMGRYGDVLLVNGIDTFELAATEGEVLRLFITNTANTRTFSFAIQGMRLKVVGSDNGRFEREFFADRLTIAPSERYVVEVRMPKPGRYEIVNDAPNAKATAGALVVSSGKAPALKGDFGVLRAGSYAGDGLAGARAKLNAQVTHTVRLSLSMDHAALPMSHGAHAPKTREKIEWTDEMAEINAKSDNRTVTWKMVDDKTKKENMGISWTIKKGDLVKIRIVNDGSSMHPMQHPIHFHGQRFVVAAVDGKANDNLAWKDSVLVGTGETLDILLEASRVGNWMAHCHIAEHLSAGMMLGFKVVE